MGRCNSPAYRRMYDGPRIFQSIAVRPSIKWGDLAMKIRVEASQEARLNGVFHNDACLILVY